MPPIERLGKIMGVQSVLVLVCRGCGHVAVWRRGEALTRCTGDASPFDLRRRATCSQCGAREQANVWVK